jgi:hypothetical protein
VWHFFCSKKSAKRGLGIHDRGKGGGVESGQEKAGASQRKKLRVTYPAGWGVAFPATLGALPSLLFKIRRVCLSLSPGPVSIFHSLPTKTNLLVLSLVLGIILRPQGKREAGGSVHGQSRRDAGRSTSAPRRNPPHRAGAAGVVSFFSPAVVTSVPCRPRVLPFVVAGGARFHRRGRGAPCACGSCSLRLCSLHLPGCEKRWEGDCEALTRFFKTAVF